MVHLRARTVVHAMIVTPVSSTASLLIASGYSVKAVQSFLGHKDASETLDTYGHLWPGDEDRLRAAIDAGFRANGHGMGTERVAEA